MLEKLFEGLIWRSRFIVILAVIFGLIGAVILFIIASMDIWQVAIMSFQVITHAIPHPEHFHEDVVAGIMLLFSFGLYELFISDIDEAKKFEEQGHQLLAINNLDQLKDKIAKVIVMVLVVNFFQRVLHTTFKTPLEMLYFALSIATLALGLYFLGMVGKKKEKKDEDK